MIFCYLCNPFEKMVSIGRYYFGLKLLTQTADR